MILNRWKSFIVVVEEISKDGLARAVGLMMEVKKKVDEEGGHWTLCQSVQWTV